MSVNEKLGSLSIFTQPDDVAEGNHFHNFVGYLKYTQSFLFYIKKLLDAVNDLANRLPFEEKANQQIATTMITHLAETDDHEESLFVDYERTIDNLNIYF